MKIIEMLVKGIKAVPVHEAKEWKNRYYLTIEGDKIVKKYIYDEREDFLYDYIDVGWLMDEGVEFKEPPKKKYLISLKRKILAIKDDSIKDVLNGEEIRCTHIANCCEFKCTECPISCKQERKTINDEEVKLHIVEY